MEQSEQNRHVEAQDVGIIFQGNYNAPGGGPAVVMQLASFRRLTGIDASGPAMVAICRLLEEEVTPRQVAKVWRDELVFEQGQFTLRFGRYIPVPWLMWLSLSFFILFFASRAFTPAASRSALRATSATRNPSAPNFSATAVEIPEP